MRATSDNTLVSSTLELSSSAFFSLFSAIATWFQSVTSLPNLGSQYRIASLVRGVELPEEKAEL